MHCRSSAPQRIGLWVFGSIALFLAIGCTTAEPASLPALAESAELHESPSEQPSEAGGGLTPAGAILVPSSTPPDDGQASSDSSEATGSASDNGTGLVTGSPIDLALGIVADPRELATEYARVYEEHAERITRCMREVGFAYTHYSQVAPQPSDFVGRSIVGQGDLLEQFGYGPVSSALGSLGSFDSGARSERGWEMSFDGMSASEEDAFWDARGQCMDQSADIADSDLPDAQPYDIAEEVSLFRQSILDGAEVAAIWTDWSSCVAENGYSFGDRGEVRDHLSNLVTEIMLSARDTIDASAVASAREQLYALEKEEEQILLIDLGCTDVHATDSRILAVLESAELQYVEENLDRLQQISDESD